MSKNQPSRRKRLLRSILLGGAIVLAVLLGLGIWAWNLTGGDHRVMETVSQNPTIPHLTLGKRIFHLETFGSPRRPLVVVVHGGPGGDYRSLLPLSSLDERYFVVFYDQRGSGLSPRVDPEELSYETSIQDLHDIITYLRTQFAISGQVRLIGHSWGAMLVTGYLGKYGKDVSHAVLGEPGFLNQKAADVFFDKMKPDVSLGDLWQMGRWVLEGMHIDEPSGQATGDYVMSQMTTSSLEGNPLRQYFCNEVLPSVGSEFWRFSWAANSTIIGKGVDGTKLKSEFTKGLKSFKRPVLLIGSECNQVMGYKFQKKFHAPLFHNAKTVELENVGHQVFSENPEAALKVIRPYLAR